MNPQLREQLPWYVNGTLGTADRAWVERALAEDREAQAELAWQRALQAGIQAGVAPIPESLGLARTLQHIAAEPQPLGRRVARQLASWLGSAGLRPAAALVVLVVVGVQGGLIVGLQRHVEDDANRIRALGASPAEEGPLLRVNFAPDAREADIRLLLVSVQASLAGGPGQMGDYYLRVPAGREEATAARLASEHIVQAVELVPGLPTHY